MKQIFKLRDFLLDIFFPQSCINCGREGSYLCQDCRAIVEILEYQYCPFCQPPKIVLQGLTCQSCKRTKKLNGLYFATLYQNFLVRKMIHQLKYNSLAKTLAKDLASLIIAHFQILNKRPDFSQYLLIPIPLDKKKLKQRGFNQSALIAKELAKTLGLPVFNEVLIKTKETPAQTEVPKEKREENVSGVFFCQNPELIKGGKILLVDDVFTTGATMEECARVLKKEGAKEVWGVAVARG